MRCLGKMYCPNSFVNRGRYRFFGARHHVAGSAVDQLVVNLAVFGQGRDALVKWLPPSGMLTAHSDYRAKLRQPRTWQSRPCGRNG